MQSHFAAAKKPGIQIRSSDTDYKDPRMPTHKAAFHVGRVVHFRGATDGSPQEGIVADVDKDRGVALVHRENSTAGWMRLSDLS